MVAASLSKTGFGISSAYPLSAALRDALGGTRRALKTTLGHYRVNVVSPQLCDDVLSYLAPSLERHRGCHIIDINPGAGLWSSKIHDFLKPKSHLLLEATSSEKAFQPFIKPLLAQSSAYGFATYDNKRRGLFIDDLWTSLKKRNLLPQSEPFEDDDPRRHEPRDDLLIMANMSNHATDKVGIKHSSFVGERLLYQLSQHLAVRSGFHSRGLVRVLLWTDESEKYFLMPRTVALRQHLAMQREECLDMQEIASTRADNTRNRRWLSLEMRSVVNTIGKMAREGTQVPPHRRSELQQAAYEIFSDPAGTEKHPVEIEDTQAEQLDPRTWLSRLEELEAKFLAGKMVSSSRRLSKSAYGKSKPDTNEHKEMISLQAKINTLIPAKWPISTQTDVEDSLFYELKVARLERALAIKQSSGEPSESTKADLQKAVEALNEFVKTAHHFSHTKGQTLADNTEAFQREEPLLAWDRRRLEPLTLDAEEFWPSYPLALFDVQPLPGKDFTVATFSPFILTALNNYHISIEKALDSLGPGFLEALLGEQAVQAGLCRSLRDPLKGGRMDLNNLRVRMLTLDMLRELVEAFGKSPFTHDHPLNRNYHLSS